MPYQVVQLTDDALRPLLATGNLTPVIEHVINWKTGEPSFTFGKFVPLRSPYNGDVWFLCRRGVHTRFED